MKRATTLSLLFALLILFSHSSPLAAQLSDSPVDIAVSQQTSQAIVVPSGFTVTTIARALSPVAWPSYWKSLQDLEVGTCAFGDYLYYIDNEVIYRINLQNGVRETFASVPAASVMDFGFNNDLFVAAADAKGTVYRVKPDKSVTKFAEVGSSTEGMTFDGQYLYFTEWNISGPDKLSRLDINGQISSFTQPNTIGTDLAGLEFCRSSFPLYVIDQPGTIFEVKQDGTIYFALRQRVDLQERTTGKCADSARLYFDQQLHRRQ